MICFFPGILSLFRPGFKGKDFLKDSFFEPIIELHGAAGYQLDAMGDFSWDPKLLSDDLSKPAHEVLQVPFEEDPVVFKRQLMSGMFLWCLTAIIGYVHSQEEIEQGRNAKYVAGSIFGTEVQLPPVPQLSGPSELRNVPGSPPAEEMQELDMIQEIAAAAAATQTPSTASTASKSAQQPATGAKRGRKSAASAVAATPAAADASELPVELKDVARHLKLLAWMKSTNIPEGHYIIFYKVIRSCWSNRKQEPFTALYTWVMSNTNLKSNDKYAATLAEGVTVETFLTELEANYRALAAAMARPWSIIEAYMNSSVDIADCIPKKKEGGVDVPLLVPPSHANVKKTDGDLNSRAKQAIQKAILVDEKMCINIAEPPSGVIDVRNQNDAWIEWLVVNWNDTKFERGMVCIDDIGTTVNAKSGHSYYEITPLGRQLLAEPEKLKEEMAKWQTKEEWLRNTGLHMQMIVGRHSSLAQQKRYATLTGEDRPKRADMFRKVYVFKLSDIKVEGAQDIANNDNNLNDVASKQKDHGFVGDIQLLRMKWVATGKPTPLDSGQYSAYVRNELKANKDPYAAGWGLYTKSAEGALRSKMDNYRLENRIATLPDGMYVMINRRAD